MAHNWKRGDVAVVTWPINADGPIEVVRDVGRWRMLRQLDAGSAEFLTDDWLDNLGATFTPLVVIDPEDRGQVERLTSIAMDVPQPFSMRIDDMQAALREFANPTPPKPEEPTGLGAVVEDAKGWKYVRHSGALAPWHVVLDGPTPERPWRYYSDLDVVRVLSEGVS